MKKTIKAKVSEETNNTKLGILERELQRWSEMMEEYFEEGKQTYEELKNDDRHATYASYARRVPSKDSPMPIAQQHSKFERKSNSVAEYWIAVPSLERHGGVWIPLEVPHKYYGFEGNWELNDSYLTKQDGNFYLHLNIEKDIEQQKEYSGILGVDLGVRHVAVTWNTKSQKPRFYGDKIREIRGKYHYLRRKLQSEKNLDAVSKLKNREKNKVETRLHQISRNIVDEAKEHNLAIFIGDLSGHRESDFGRKGNRKLHSAPTFELKRQIKYKAKEEGVLCKEIDESYTTVTCSECGNQRDSRPNAQFKCPECKYQVNSDINGSKNIASRGSSYMLESGVSLDSPNPASNNPIEPTA